MISYFEYLRLRRRRDDDRRVFHLRSVHRRGWASSPRASSGRPARSIQHAAQLPAYVHQVSQRVRRSWPHARVVARDGLASLRRRDSVRAARWPPDDSLRSRASGTRRRSIPARDSPVGRPRTHRRTSSTSTRKQERSRPRLWLRPPEIWKSPRTVGLRYGPCEAELQKSMLHCRWSACVWILCLLQRSQLLSSRRSGAWRSE